MRVVERISDDAGTLGQLTDENRRLRNELMLSQARMARLQTLAADNARLRGLLDAADRGKLEVVLAPVLDVDLDPTRQRLVLDAGTRDRVKTGQSVIDAGGLLGQIIAVTPMYANVLLLTDPSHAVPVAVARNGVRLVVYGEGRSDMLRLTSVPLSSDVKVGDVLVTSGLGGRFAPGFPVGTIASLKPDDSRAFLVGEVTPAAQLDRGREVLVLLSTPNPLPGATAFNATEGASASGLPSGSGGAAAPAGSSPAPAATTAPAPATTTQNPRPAQDAARPASPPPTQPQEARR